MKKALFFLLIIFIVSITSCVKEQNNIDSYNDLKESKLFVKSNSERDDCIKTFYSDNTSLNYPINVIGKYHNDVIKCLENNINFTNICDSNQFVQTQELIDSFINSTSPYDTFFYNINTKVTAPYIYMKFWNVCDNSKTPSEKILNMFDSLNILATPYLSSFERNTINNFINEIFNDNQTVDSIINKYVNIVNSNTNNFYKNGIFTLTLLSIYENSYCYWNDYINRQNGIGLRVAPNPMKTALMDLAGAYIAFLVDTIETNGMLSEDSPKKWLRGAMNASIPLVGDLLFRWIFD